jgi:alpha-mannosidase
MSADGYGVSILSDRKHGYDHKPNELRLTLLRGSEWPDPDADKGVHRFSLAIYPHAGDWQAAKTVQQSREFSQPLQAIVFNPESTTGELNPASSLLDLGCDHLVLTALKRSEDDPETFILRCYEAHGEMAELNLTGAIGLKIADRVDLLERVIEDQTPQITPWQIASFQVCRSL